MGYENRDYHRDSGRPDIRFTMPKLSPLFAGIAGTCLTLFILQAAMGRGLSAWLVLNFDGGRGLRQPWRLVTFQYVHLGTVQLFITMLTLYSFLPWLEALWGRWRTFAFYTLGGIAGGMCFGLLGLLIPRYFGGILFGATSSVFAVIGACALYFGDRPLNLLFFPITMRGVAALLGLFFLLSTFADGDYSDSAHLGGLAFGFFAPYLAGPKVRDWQDGWRRRQTSKAIQREVDDQAEIDRILAKVSASGMHSLTRGEQRTLKSATLRQQRAPQKPARSVR